jgi:hypothetical protein
MSARERFDFHRRHYLPLYALGTLLVLVVALFPSESPRARSRLAPASDLAGASPNGGALGDGAAAGAAPVANAATAGVRAAAAKTGAATRALAPAQQQTGVTRGGFACKPGVRQLPWSIYATACMPRFDGDNGGATYRGVTKNTIKVVIRKLPDDNLLDPLFQQQGLGDPAAWDVARRAFAAYFDKNFELYGRKVVFELYNGRGSTVKELNEQGDEDACLDAKDIAEERQAFAVIFWSAAGTSGPFSNCAAQRQLFVPWGAPYFPESYYKGWHPYVWSWWPQGEDIAHDTAEYIGKRLKDGRARWAGDPEYQKQKRVYGMFVPKNRAYRMIGDLLERDLRDKWGITVKQRYDYELDPSTWGQQTAEAVVQFKNAGVTTLVLSTEFVSVRLLTNHARAQGWYPEWLMTGAAAQDLETAAREYQQDEVDGHMFGLSQAGGPKLFDRAGEAWRTWKLAAPDAEPPTFMEVAYHFMIDLYNKFQLAGPNLTPQNIATGLQRYAGGAPDAAFGVWSYTDDHTPVDDTREVYWLRDVPAYDGKAGLFVETYGGRRFLGGQWPAEEPKVYPGR